VTSYSQFAVVLRRHRYHHRHHRPRYCCHHRST